MRRSAILVGNWRGAATVPSPALYPAPVELGLAPSSPSAPPHWSQQPGGAELASLFGGQWRTGGCRTSCSTRPCRRRVLPRACVLAVARGRRQDTPVATSGIVQPPVHARCVRNARDHGPATAFLRRITAGWRPKDRYLREHRIVDGLGLAAIVHPWESGLDNSPLWDAPLARVPADLSLLRALHPARLDHAGDHERPTDGDYARYIRLAEAYRDPGYDDARAHDRPSSRWSTHSSTPCGPRRNGRWQRSHGDSASTRLRTSNMPL